MSPPEDVTPVEATTAIAVVTPAIVVTSTEAVRFMLRLRGADVSGLADWPEDESPEVPELLARAREAGITLHAARLTLRELGRERLPVIGRGDDGVFFVIEEITDAGIRWRPARDGPAELASADAFVARWSGVVVSPDPLGVDGADMAAASAPTAGGAPAQTSSGAARRISVGLAVLLIALCALAAWLALSTVPTTMQANGQAVPPGAGEPVVAGVAGAIERIAVAEGTEVSAGDVVLVITVTVTTPQAVEVADLVEARVAIARADAMLAAIAINERPVLKPVADLDPVRRTVEQQHLAARFEEFRSRLAAIDSETGQRKVERLAAEELIARATESLEVARKAEADGKHLYSQGFISRNAATERSERRAEIERDLERHRALVAGRSRALDELDVRRRSTREELERTLRAERDEGVDLLAKLEKPLPPKVTTESSEVMAPSAGTVIGVEGLAPGRVVERGERLFAVRRAATVFEIDAPVDGASVARVRPGQPARATGPVGEMPMRVVQVSGIEGSNAGSELVTVRLRYTGPESARPDSGNATGAVWVVTIDTGEETRFERLTRRR